MGHIKEMGTAVPKRQECVKMPMCVKQDGSVPSFRHMRMFEIGRHGGLVLTLAIRDSTESSSLSVVCPHVRSVSKFILVSCILTRSFLIHVVRNFSVARSVTVRFTRACPDCARVFSANGLRCGLLLIPFRQFGIRRHSLAKGQAKGHTAHYKRPQGCKLLIYRLLMLMTTGSAR